jgi:SET domain-containing protein
MNLDALLQNIAHTRVRLGVSPIHGVGVFAMTDIPAGTGKLFAPPQDWPALPLARIAELPELAQKLINTYCLQDDEFVYLPPNGFRVLDLVMYLNHSATPNLKQVNAGDDFVTLCDIAKGEELTLDYGTLETTSEPEASATDSE